MCIACNVPLNQEKSDAFAERLLGTLNEAGLALMLSLGHRTGLFDAFAGKGSLTSHELAEAGGMRERYVREWLGAMTVAGIVEHDAESLTYHLPDEHAAFLTRAAVPNNLAGVFQWIAVLAEVESDVAAAFEHGRGVPYERYSRFNDVMAEESGQTVVAALHEHILPLIPEIVGRLERGIDVMDLGCGRGKALIDLARIYPNSRFVGYDLLEDAVHAANEEAQQLGLTNIRFAALDATRLDEPGRYDFITTFDAIHDQARPDAVLENIHKALRPGGVYLCQEIKAETPHAGNLDHPLGTFLYTISCMNCMSVSLAQGGMGLGAVWGRQQCEAMMRQAGFTHLERHELPHDIQNDFYVLRKPA